MRFARSFYIFLIVVLAFSLGSAQEVPQFIHYQGNLASANGNPVNDNLQMFFRIFDVESDGSFLWEERHATVEIEDGLFSVVLGSVDSEDNPLTSELFSGPRYLEIEISTEVLVPRQKIGSVAFALTSDSVRGFTVDESGNVGIGTTNPLGPLHVKLSDERNTMLVENNSSLGSTPRLGFVDTALGPVTDAPVWLIDNENDRFRIFREPSLTTPGLEFMTISNSGNVGIGTMEPNEKLDIVGNLDVSGVIHGQRNAGSGDVIFLGNDTKLIDINIANTVGLYGLQDTTQGHIKLGSSGTILSGVNGNIGIGTSNPTQKLHVVGNIRTSGSITEGSSRELKESISDLATSEALRAFNKLTPVKYSYKAEASKDLHVGFIAEDVPGLLATPDRKGLRAMDIVAVLTKVLQEQQNRVSQLEKELSEIKKALK